MSFDLLFWGKKIFSVLRVIYFQNLEMLSFHMICNTCIFIQLENWVKWAFQSKQFESQSVFRHKPNSRSRIAVRNFPKFQ